jgi:hypothetical protein
MAATHDIDWPAVLVPHLDLPMRRHGVRHSSRQEVPACQGELSRLVQSKSA